MSTIIKSIHKFEDSFDRKAERFAFHHPYLSFAMMFLGLPLIILMAVVALTTVFALPIAWIFSQM